MFIEDYTAGFDDLKRAGRDAWIGRRLKRRRDWIARAMEEFARLIHDAKNAVLVWSMGITQHAYGGDAVQMVLNLGLTQGLCGPRQMRARCRFAAIRSVQGGAEMGAYATAFPGGKPVNAGNAKKLSGRIRF